MPRVDGLAATQQFRSGPQNMCPAGAVGLSDQIGRQVAEVGVEAGVRTVVG
jgi:hypothetical protein